MVDVLLGTINSSGFNKFKMIIIIKSKETLRRRETSQEVKSAFEAEYQTILTSYVQRLVR